MQVFDHDNKELKIGDKIIRHKNWNPCSDITVGKEYTIIELQYHSVFIIDDRGERDSFDADKFTLVPREILNWEEYMEN